MISHNIKIGFYETDTGTAKPEQYGCVDCGKQAEVFFPCNDLQLNRYPGCKSCAKKVERARMKEIGV